MYDIFFIMYDQCWSWPLSWSLNWAYPAASASSELLQACLANIFSISMVGRSVGGLLGGSLFWTSVSLRRASMFCLEYLSTVAEWWIFEGKGVAPRRGHKTRWIIENVKLQIWKIGRTRTQCSKLDSRFNVNETCLKWLFNCITSISLGWDPFWRCLKSPF